MKRRLWLCCFVYAFTATCLGQEKPAKVEPQQGGELLLGVGVLVKNEPYKGVSDKIYPLPFYVYRGQRWSLQGTRFDYNILDINDCSLNTILRFRTEGFDADDSSDLDGMSDRDASLDAGLGLSVSGEWGALNVDLLTDALGKHKGQEFKLTYAKSLESPFGIAKTRLRPFFGTSWRSSGLNDYYYGVRLSEARPGRLAYDSGDSTNVFAGITLDYQLSDRWNLFLMFRNEWLGSEITDSPIVDQHHTNSFIAGLMYRF